MNNKKACDWELIIITNPIHNYLNRLEIKTLNTASKVIRSKLNRIVFHTIKLNQLFLNRNRKYFKPRVKIFESLSYLDKINLLKKVGFGEDLVFKERQIDIFIDLASEELDKVAKNCKVLKFEKLTKTAYFIFTLTDKFINLTSLTLIDCDIPYNQFKAMLTNLNKLEILYLSSIHFIISQEENYLSTIINFPLSLQELTYKYISLAITNLPQNNPLIFMKTRNFCYIREYLELPTQQLPNLVKFEYDSMYDTNEFQKFININTQLKFIVIDYALILNEHDNTINWSLLCNSRFTKLIQSP